MNEGRFWLVQRVRDELDMYGIVGTYYLLRETHSLPKTIYVMWVASRINKHRSKNEISSTIGVRTTPNLD